MTENTITSLKAGQWVKCVKEDFIILYGGYRSPAIELLLNSWYEILFFDESEEDEEGYYIHFPSNFIIGNLPPEGVNTLLDEEMQQYFDLDNPCNYNPMEQQ